MYLMISKQRYAANYSVEEFRDIASLTLAIKACYETGSEFRLAKELGINFDIVPIEETRAARIATALNAPRDFVNRLKAGVAERNERGPVGDERND